MSQPSISASLRPLHPPSPSHNGHLQVTSWDTSNGVEQTNYKKKRAFLRCITEYDDSDKYKCSGHSKKDMGTCRMVRRKDVRGSCP